jgi:transcriptional regulator with XRE-family HTH domain
MESIDVPEDLIRVLEQNRLGRDQVPQVPPRDFVAEFVRLQRKMLGWKQEALASFAGVSLSTIQRIERGDQVCDSSLDRVAVAIHQKLGAFTEPRVPLVGEALIQKLKESVAFSEDRQWVRVRPLRNQRQIAELVRSQFYLIDAVRLGDTCNDRIAALYETLDSVAFALATEDEDSIVECFAKEPIKRRDLFSMVLDQVSEIERHEKAIALAGTYQAETGIGVLRTVAVALIGFFPKATDPGATKRPSLLAPTKLNLGGALRRFRLDAEDDAPRISTPTTLRLMYGSPQ